MTPCMSKVSLKSLLKEMVTSVNWQPGVDISPRLCMTFTRVTCVTLSKPNGGDNSDIFVSRSYELTPPFGFDVTQVTRANVIHNLVEISTPASRFAPVNMLDIKHVECWAKIEVDYSLFNFSWHYMTVQAVRCMRELGRYWADAGSISPVQAQFWHVYREMCYSLLLRHRAINQMLRHLINCSMT